MKARHKKHIQEIVDVLHTRTRLNKDDIQDLIRDLEVLLLEKKYRIIIKDGKLSIMDNQKVVAKFVLHSHYEVPGYKIYSKGNFDIDDCVRFVDFCKHLFQIKDVPSDLNIIKRLNAAKYT